MITENKQIYTVTEGETDGGEYYVRVEGVYPFDVTSTFECGQCFRFNKIENPEDYGEFGVGYEGVALGEYIKVFSPAPDTAVIVGATASSFAEKWEKYFCFDMDYKAVIDAIKEKWGSDSRLAAAADKGAGIRILRQDPWEALCSFIISQNNNIPRIKGIIERLSESFGSRIYTKNGVKYAFPTPIKLYEADTDGIASARMGFRARYVFDAARELTFDSTFVSRIRGCGPYAMADGHLRGIKGVGPKVSACTLLFGFQRYDAFPVDVWIKRTVGKYFPGEKPDAIDFGELAPYKGIIQQYIFNFERNCGGEYVNEMLPPDAEI